VLAVLTLKAVVVRRGHAAGNGRRTEQRDDSSGKGSGEED